jgi:predicted AAA+ superfamily ATPase
MYKRIFRPPTKSFFLFGPRGSGKSTLLKSLYPNAHVFNLLMEREYQSYLVDPELFYNKVQALPKNQWVIVDEIQRLPELLNYVHQLIEEKKWKFVLTGSSARKLKRSGTNLLAGRAITRQLFPFTPEEIGLDFDLKKCLQYGTLPIVWDSDDKEETLNSYVETYLKQEIKEEALVKNLGGFSRFLRIAAVMHGQTLNISNIARDSEVARTTATGFFEILTDTLIGERLEPYSPKLRVREAKHSKFYFCDPGIVRALKGHFGALRAEEIGSLFEGFIFQILKAYQSYHKTFDEIYFWQPAEAEKTEVDFLLRKEDSFCAIEVKATNRVRPDDLRGLKAIRKLPGLKRKILVYTGKDSQRLSEDIEVMPILTLSELLRTNTLF